MKLKRMRHRTSGSVYLAAEVSGRWMLLDQGSAGNMLALLDYTLAELVETFELMPCNEDEYEELLPFHPVAYRDFMLYEQHAINAARGFVRKYMPRRLPIVNLFERLTGQVFPKLKPAGRYYQFPIYYMGNHLNFITNNQPIAMPAYTRELDYELEIAAVIAKPLQNASPEEATDAIAGFVILNDFSARDIQLDEMQSGFGPVKSKNFGNAISSVVVGKPELLDVIDELRARVLINDEVVEESSSKGKRYSFQEAIAYASWEEDLHPGELFGSGTLPMCSGIENGRMLKRGDRIALEVEGIGRLSNFVE